MDTPKIEVTKEQFLDYERVRLSGVTNMFDVKYVEYLTGLSRPVIFDIMKNYMEYKNKYIPAEK